MAQGFRVSGLPVFRALGFRALGFMALGFRDTTENLSNGPYVVCKHAPGALRVSSSALPYQLSSSVSVSPEIRSRKEQVHCKELTVFVSKKK